MIVRTKDCGAFEIVNVPDGRYRATRVEPCPDPRSGCTSVGTVWDGDTLRISSKGFALLEGKSNRLDVWSPIADPEELVEFGTLPPY